MGATLDRFSFHDDALVQEVGSLLARRPGTINILDCGCGDCRLARALMVAHLATKRINYDGFDLDQPMVRAARAEKLQGRFAPFKRFEVSLRETPDLAGYKQGSYHLVVLRHLLHEIGPESLPQVFRKVKALLVPRGGTVCIVDIEELPADVDERWAVMWTGDEMEGLLTAAGFEVALSKHPHSVPAYRAVATPRRDLDPWAIQRKVRDLLVVKEHRLLNDLLVYRDKADISAGSLRAVCRLAAIRVALRRIETERLYA
jgi:hypothetical protein